MFQSDASHLDSFISSAIRQRPGLAVDSDKRLRMSRLCRLAARGMKKIVVLLLASCVAICVADAQSTFGSIRGTVTDVTGAIVIDATITAQSLDDSVEHKTSSTISGEFVLENLKPGHYRIMAHHDGFRDVVAPSVALDARQELRLPFVLSVAVTTTAVEVSAGAEQVNTENGTIGDTILNDGVTQLPMNSRAVHSSPLAALALSPDVVKDSQGNISVGGATSAQTGFSVDGISTASVRANGALQDAYPSQEGISEMKVTAFNNNAEFAQIGDVTFVTKSGTNQLHGSAFEYFQDSALDGNLNDLVAGLGNGPLLNPVADIELLLGTKVVIQSDIETVGLLAINL